MRSASSMKHWNPCGRFARTNARAWQQLDEAKSELQAAQSEMMTVEAVQKAALGKGQTGTDDGCRRQKLDAQPPTRAAA